MQDVYEKEGTLVPFDVMKVEFTIYQHPKSVKDDPMLFLVVDRIPDSMLRKWVRLILLLLLIFQQ